MTSALVKCGCGHVECDAWVCSVCHSPECKYPGDCYGKCTWCGSPTRPRVVEGSTHMRGDGRGPWMELSCSPACKEADLADATNRGCIVLMSELTHERTVQMLGDAGIKVGDIAAKVVSS